VRRALYRAGLPRSRRFDEAGRVFIVISPGSQPRAVTSMLAARANAGLAEPVALRKTSQKARGPEASAPFRSRFSPWRGRAEHARHATTAANGHGPWFRTIRSPHRNHQGLLSRRRAERKFLTRLRRTDLGTGSRRKQPPACPFSRSSVNVITGRETTPGRLWAAIADSVGSRTPAR